MKLNYFSKTVVGLVRKANEDCIGHITTPNKSNLNLRIVCDGMGGHIGGAKASNIAVNSIIEYFSNTPNPVPQVALSEAISFANLQIFGFAQAKPEFKGMGTTCTVLLESEGLIYIAHVGDSRIYIHTDKKLYRITKDHSYVQDLVDKGEITDLQMETHPKKNELTRALGIAEEVEVEVASKPILAKSGDSFLLCSDGLNGRINDRMINSVINTNNTLETKCNNLITMAEAAGGHDNISVDLIEVHESKHINTQFVNKNNKDLIDTKTQQIIIDPQSQKKNPLGFLRHKVTAPLIVVSILFVTYFGYQKFQISDGHQGDSEHVGTKNDTGDSSTTTGTDTIKVVVEKGWGTKRLNTEFETKVNEKVGADNYCKDCPAFYKKGSNKPISIHEYRNNVKNLGLGDFLMVTITDGIVDMPEINKNGKIEEKEPINQFSEETKKEKERLEKERLENEKRKAEEAELEVEKSEVDRSEDKSVDTTETEKKKKKSEKVNKTKADTLNEK
jgi:serine/threonine protein phosphatase PrpC